MRADTTFAVAAVLLVSVAGLFIAGEACNNVPSMTSDDACINSCVNTREQEQWQKLCQETLLNAPKAAELTVYALTAARLAKLKYKDTVAEMDRMLGTGKLTAVAKAAVDHCKAKYGEAQRLMAGVEEQLFGCTLAQVRQEYVDAQVAVGSCQDGLWSYSGLPLSEMVSADVDLTMVSYLLGALIVGK